MATVEERLTAIEHKYVDLKHDNDELKKNVELHTIAIGALVNKGTLEKINEQNGKIFDALIAHDQITNMQLAELREGEAKLDGKVVGMQTEMRQRFEQVEGKVVGIQTEMRQRFEQVENRFAGMESRISGVEDKLEQILDLLAGQGPRL